MPAGYLKLIRSVSASTIIISVAHVFNQSLATWRDVVSLPSCWLFSLSALTRFDSTTLACSRIKYGNNLVAAPSWLLLLSKAFLILFKKESMETVSEGLNKTVFIWAPSSQLTWPSCPICGSCTLVTMFAGDTCPSSMRQWRKYLSAWKLLHILAFIFFAYFVVVWLLPWAAFGTRRAPEVVVWRRFLFVFVPFVVFTCFWRVRRSTFQLQWWLYSLLDGYILSHTLSIIGITKDYFFGSLFYEADSRHCKGRRFNEVVNETLCQVLGYEKHLNLSAE